MPSRVSAFVRCVGALLLLTASTWLVEFAAFLFLWRTETLAPYAFFPNQSYDFLAKLRWFAPPALSWAPPLPDHFAGVAAAAKVAALAPLLPATLTTALILGATAGLLRALLPGRVHRLRRDLVGWALVAIVVHVAVSLPAFGLDDGLRITKLAYRARSLVVDGMLLASTVSLVAFALAWLIAPLVERSRAVAGSGLVAIAAVTALAWGQAVPRPTPLAAAPVAVSDPSQPRRNVVLISLDSLRADHVGAYGYKRDTTPNIDRFAHEGVLFRHLTSSSSWTLPTHLTMFTGRSQISHGVVVDTLVLSTAIPTLGEIFHEAGYATAGFASGPYVNGHYGYERGMDTYEDLSAGQKGAEARDAVLAPAVSDKALEWLQNDHAQPFFLFLHYFDIHYDYVPPPPYDKMFDPDYTGTFDGRSFIERSDVNAKMARRDLEHIIALYDGEIRSTDAEVGRVLDMLRSKGLLDNTIVMIVADHGDEFFEHGNKGHHRTVYDEVLHVPLILHLPGNEHAGKSVDGQASLLDVFPTLLDAASITPARQTEGESLLGWLRGNASSRDAVFSDFYDKRGFNLQVSRRTPTEKTIQHFNRITHPKQASLEYYDLEKDVAEKKSRVSDHPFEVEHSVDLMSGWLEQQWRFHRSAEAVAGTGSIEIDANMKQKLKSLGYVGD